MRRAQQKQNEVLRTSAKELRHGRSNYNLHSCSGRCWWRGLVFFASQTDALEVTSIKGPRAKASGFVWLGFSGSMAGTSSSIRLERFEWQRDALHRAAELFDHYGSQVR